MRFRIPRSILRAAIAANLFVAASAVCYSSIPGNRNNSYQPIGLVDVAEAEGLMTFGRIDKLPNFVLYSPVSTKSENAVSIVNETELSVATTPNHHPLDSGCEIDQDFSGSWMTCPEENGQFASEVDAPAIEDQKQISFIDQQQFVALAGSAADALCYALDIVRDYAIEVPFDSGEAVAEFFALPKSQSGSPTIGKDSGNIFVYVIEQIDASDEEAGPISNAIVTDSIQPSLVTVNPFQSGVQDLITEIESSITSKTLGCGYDPYESCFPNEISESVAVNDSGSVENTRLVSEDDFIPFHIKLLSGQLDVAMVDSVDAGVGHCAVPSGIDHSGETLTASRQIDSNANEEILSSEQGVDADSVGQMATFTENQWLPQLEAARSIIENWTEPNWDIKKWEFVTRSSDAIAERKTLESYRSTKFRWDAVYGRIDSPMLSEIPMDPSLTLAQDLYPQPRWYVSSNSVSPVEPIEEADGVLAEESAPQIEVATIEPKESSNQLVPLAQKAWASIGQAINIQYMDASRVWQRLAVDSKRMVATQMKQIGGLLLRSADSLEGNIGIAKRDAHQNDGNR
ncbi:MAG: hypothetical protein ACK506_08595 [Pirellula sp.]|jgi:hypothetical protein